MKLSIIGKKMIFFVAVTALVFIAGGIIFFRSIEALYFAFGVVLTSGLNAIKVFLLERTVNRTLDMDDPNTGGNYVKLQYLLRYFLTAVVLALVALVQIFADPPFINVIGAILGIFTLQISVIIVRHMKFENNPS
ncbi:MAG: hypothetical protein FWB75_09225 [Oscillospiraceae bacterium]|nr:hypothetical protein [Oscillospiraceae bacterium]